jgi:hypothetical protein
VAVQTLVPLRHFWGNGDVLWTEDGFRFAWNVMIVEKAGRARFTARDPDTGREREIEPADYLTPTQLRAVTTQPDLILAFARRIAERIESEGAGPVEIRADAYVSANGRPARRVYDPALDLAHLR